MKTIANIFEGIFNQSIEKIDDNLRFYDPNSAFNKEWILQFPYEREREFELEGNILHVDNQRNSSIHINLEIPLAQCLPGVDTTEFSKDIVIKMTGRPLDETYLGRNIKLKYGARILGATSLENICINGNRSVISIWNCLSFINCEFNNVKNLFICDLKDLNAIKSCKITGLELFAITCDGIFDHNDKIFDTLIDWDTLANTISPSDYKSLIEHGLAGNNNFYKDKKYCEIPLTKHGKDIIKHLFKSSTIDGLKKIYITDGDMSLCFKFGRLEKCILYHNSQYNKFK